MGCGIGFFFGFFPLLFFEQGKEFDDSAPFESKDMPATDDDDVRVGSFVLLGTQYSCLSHGSPFSGEN